MAATEYGRALLECGTAVFDDIRHALKKIAFLADESGGHVRLGSPPPIAETFASAVIERLSRRHQRMVFELTAMGTALPRLGRTSARSSDRAARRA